MGKPSARFNKIVWPDVTNTRRLFLFAALLYPSFYFFFQWAVEDAKDSLIERVAMSSIAILMFYWSHIAGKASRTVFHLLALFCLLATLQVSFLVFRNNVDPNYVLGLMVLIAAVQATIARPLWAISYSVLVLISAALTCVAVETPKLSPYLYLPFLSTVLFLGVLFNQIRYRQSQRMEFLFAKLRESKKLSDNILDSIPYPVLVESLGHEKEFSNQAFERSFPQGMDPVELPEAFQVALKGDSSEKAFNYIESEISYNESAGGKKTYLLKRAPVTGLGGKVLIVGTYQDISKVKPSEDRMKLFKILTDHSPESVLLVDNAGRICYANRRACHVLEFSEQGMIGKRIGLVSELTKDKWQDTWKTCETQSFTQFDMTLQSKAGQIIDVNTTATLIESNGLKLICLKATDTLAKKLAS